MKISVCIATYNGEKYIKEQIDSILLQLSENDEIIISDDYSTDNTLKIIEQYKDKRIKIYFNEKEKGYTKNFENALTKATGDIIFLSDQDDIWLKHKVKKSLKKLLEGDLLISNSMVINNKKEVIEKSIFEVFNTKTGLLNNLLTNRYPGCCMAFKRRILKKILPFPKNQELAPHDIWIPIVAEMYYKVLLEEIPCMLYRRHDNNVSIFKEKSKNTFLKKILLRLYPLINSLLRVKK